MKENKATDKKKPRESKWFERPLNSFIRNQIESKAVETVTLAVALGVSAEAVRQWSGGYSRPDIDKLLSIAEYFKVSIDFLLGGTEFSTTDPKIREVCEYTGLSQKTISKLHDYVLGNSQFSREFLDASFRLFDIIIGSDAVTIHRPLLDALRAPTEEKGYYPLEASETERVFLVDLFDVHMQFFARNFDRLRQNPDVRKSTNKSKEVTDNGGNTQE